MLARVRFEMLDERGNRSWCALWRDADAPLIDTAMLTVISALRSISTAALVGVTYRWSWYYRNLVPQPGSSVDAGLVSYYASSSAAQLLYHPSVPDTASMDAVHVLMIDGDWCDPFGNDLVSHVNTIPYVR